MKALPLLGRLGLPLLLLLLLLLSACAHKQYTFEYIPPAQFSEEKKQAAIWPMPPDIPRYKYVGDIVGEENFRLVEESEGSIRKVFSWLGNFIFGEDAPLRLQRPQSGLLDEKNQRLYITDVGLKKLLLFDIKTGKLETLDGDATTELKTPIAVSLIGDDIHVTDADAGEIFVFSSQGELIRLYGKKELKRPTGIAYDSLGQRVFVADSQVHKIHVFSTQGKWLKSFGQKGALNGKFNSPTHLAVNADKLLVSDTLNARVQIFDTQGNWLQSFGRRGTRKGDMPRPKGIAFDSDSNIYVAESNYDHLLMFNSLGQRLLAIGGTGNKAGQFDLPAGIWVDKSDKVYVADILNRRISVFQYLREAND